MVFVKNDLSVRLRHMFAHRANKGIPHVHGHAFDRILLFFAECRPKAIQSRFRAFLGRTQETAVHEAVDNRQIAMTFPKCSFVNDNVFQWLGNQTDKTYSVKTRLASENSSHI